MYVNAIKEGTDYVRPLVTGKVTYENRQILNIINSLMILNSDGDCLTCAHIAELFLAAEDTNEVFSDILKQIKHSSKREIKKIEEKYGIKKDTIIRIHNIVVDVAKNIDKIDIIKHPYLDLAIIKLHEKVNIKNFPIFNTEDIKIGTSILNLGYAFPEYDTFKYDLEKERMIVTNKVMNFPLFPSPGIITRNIIDPKNELSLFETNAPCYPGQAGGPVLNVEGEVIGLTLASKIIKIHDTQNSSYTVELSAAIKSKTITEFLDENNITYTKR